MRSLVTALAAVAAVGCGDPGELGELGEVRFSTGNLCFRCEQIHGVALGAEVDVSVSIPLLADDGGVGGCPGPIAYAIDGDALAIVSTPARFDCGGGQVRVRAERTGSAKLVVRRNGATLDRFALFVARPSYLTITVEPSVATRSDRTARVDPESVTLAPEAGWYGDASAIVRDRRDRALLTGSAVQWTSLTDGVRFIEFDEVTRTFVTLERTTGDVVSAFAPPGTVGSIRAAFGDEVASEISVTFPRAEDAGRRDGG